MKMVMKIYHLKKDIDSKISLINSKLPRINNGLVKSKKYK